MCTTVLYIYTGHSFPPLAPIGVLGVFNEAHWGFDLCTTVTLTILTTNQSNCQHFVDSFLYIYVVVVVWIHGWIGGSIS